MTYRRARQEGRSGPAGRAAVAVSGALSALAGSVLAVGGDPPREGSALELFAGLGLIVSGFLLSLRHRASKWTYILLLAGGAGCSLRNVAGSLGPEQPTIRNPASSERAAGTPPALLQGGSERLIERTSTMMHDWQTSLRTSDDRTARILPPATVGETAWDILLALHSDRHWRLSPRKLASMASVPAGTVDRWLGALEERKLITGARDPSTDELLAVLTEAGVSLLDRYLSATKEIAAGAQGL